MKACGCWDQGYHQRQFDDPDGYHYSPFWMKPDTDPTV